MDDINRMTKHRHASWKNDDGRGFYYVSSNSNGRLLSLAFYTINNSGNMCKLLSSFVILTIANLHIWVLCARNFLEVISMDRNGFQGVWR